MAMIIQIDVRISFIEQITRQLCFFLFIIYDPPFVY